MENKLPVTVGTITIDSCEYQKPEGNDFQSVDYFPEFLITGTVKQKDGDYNFTRKVAVELDGRDADQEHVSGFDLETIPWDGSEFDRGQVDSDLYEAIYETPAYKQQAELYHGKTV